jgi:hypothetical protein
LELDLVIMSFYDQDFFQRFHSCPSFKFRKRGLIPFQEKA